MNVELRWLHKPRTTTEAARLQYRGGSNNSETGWTWDEWQDVPRVVDWPAPPCRPASGSDEQRST